jgi:hypothetical protein
MFQITIAQGRKENNFIATCYVYVCARYLLFFVIFLTVRRLSTPLLSTEDYGLLSMVSHNLEQKKVSMTGKKRQNGQMNTNIRTVTATVKALALKRFSNMEFLPLTELYFGTTYAMIVIFGITLSRSAT